MNEQKLSKETENKPDGYTLLGDVCSQCENYNDKLYSFNNEPKRCAYCMKSEGLCQKCGDYIPFPDDNDDDDPLHQLCDSSDYAPELCLECFNSNDA